MESLIAVSAAVGMCIGTSLCCFWFSAQGQAQECRDMFLGVGSFALLVAGMSTSHVSRFYEEALKEIHIYSVIPRVDSQTSLSTIAEEETVEV